MLHPKIRIDDPLDASVVHGFCGAWGVLAAGFFADPLLVNEVALTDGRGGGIFYGYGLNLIIQVIDIVVTTGWTMFFTLISFGIM